MSNTPYPNATTWVKSTYSGGEGGQCVEWAPAAVATSGAVPIRDSKVPHGPILTVSPAAWASFVAFAVRSDG
ncbi:DUF397 domain-containing protein [Streptomyces varsoviensis]|uniref:DUF397 domain-containing protein n=1 Tax=Streptomyces varsoviensis TaxID=67373 RepID=A0ABR5ISC9_9ACTN|nr:DUF397 domain-containing protein [Streptomyces varsoviensis]KOG52003.1 hypothetical protein ADK38_44410 [Streptomyces varsoviensis]